MGKYLDATGLSYFISKIKTTFQEKLVSGTNIKTINNTSLLGNGNIGISYAESSSAGGNANYTNAILYGIVDSTSTSTAYTATVAGLDQLVDGTCVMLHNGVVTSAEGFTVDINGLGAKPCYSNLTNATRDTTIFNVAYTMLFVYAESLNNGDGGWWIYRGYDANTNTIGYQLRTNSANKVAADTGYRYRIWLTSADGSKWVPINTSTSTNATSNRSLNTRAIDPFGPIIYRPANGSCTAGTGLGNTGIWQQYILNIGYSYMASGFSLSFPDSVYLKCTPNADGSATMNSIVQALPSSKDGKIYIHLGTAYSATNMELQIEHPVYWHDGTGIRIWTGAEPSGGGSTVTVTQSLSSGTQVGSISVDGVSTALYAPTPPTASTTAPSMDGTASYGSGTSYARSNHVHPTDTSRQETLVSGTNIKTINNGSILGSGNITLPTTSDIPTKTSDLTNDSGFITNAGVTSFNGSTGAITYTAPVTSVNGSTGAVTVSVPSASTTNPSMDGTASYGSGTDYARANHVHPTDTSRQATLVSGTNIKTVGGQSLLGSGDLTVANIGAAASSHAHGNITNGGDITATAPTIASGDCLVINDDSASKVTNGPSFGTSTSTYLRNDGSWNTPTDTKNTAGSTNSTSKLYLIGANSQAANPQTYSSSSVYETDGALVADSFNGVVLGTEGTTDLIIGTASSSSVIVLTDVEGRNLSIEGVRSGAQVVIPSGSSFTLAGACAKAVDSSISAGSTSTNLPTTAAVVNYVAGMTTSITMEDTDVDDAVDAAWSGVNISMANGVSF